jgi:hypothetical protein
VADRGRSSHSAIHDDVDDRETVQEPTAAGKQPKFAAAGVGELRRKDFRLPTFEEVHIPATLDPRMGAQVPPKTVRIVLRIATTMWYEWPTTVSNMRRGSGALGCWGCGRVNARGLPVDEHLSTVGVSGRPPSVASVRGVEMTVRSGTNGLQKGSVGDKEGL